MKKLVLLFAFVGTIATFQAQLKVAHVNSQKLLDTLPSRKVSISQLKEFEKNGIEELKDMEAELQKIYSKYLQNKEKLGPQFLQIEESKIQSKQQSLQQRQQEIQDQLQILERQLTEKSYNTLKKAVENVAKQKKITFVLAESQTLFSDLSTDITADVMVELLKLDAAETAPKK